MAANCRAWRRVLTRALNTLRCVCRAPQPLDAVKASKLSSQLVAHPAGPPATQPVLRPPAGTTAAQPAALPAASTYTPAQWPGTDLLKFVPEPQFRLLQQSQQLWGLHQHLGHSYALPVAAVESAAQEGKAALVVGSVHLAEQLRSELPELQVRPNTGMKEYIVLTLPAA